MKSTFPGTGSKAARVEAEAKAEAAEAEALASTRYGAQRVRSTVTLDLAGREKGELSQRDYTNPSSTELQVR